MSPDEINARLQAQMAAAAEEEARKAEQDALIKRALDNLDKARAKAVNDVFKPALESYVLKDARIECGESGGFSIGTSYYETLVAVWFIHPNASSKAAIIEDYTIAFVAKLSAPRHIFVYGGTGNGRARKESPIVPAYAMRRFAAIDLGADRQMVDRALGVALEGLLPDVFSVRR